jgi:hypothetical protein
MKRQGDDYGRGESRSRGRVRLMRGEAWTEPLSSVKCAVAIGVDESSDAVLRLRTTGSAAVTAVNDGISPADRIPVGCCPTVVERCSGVEELTQMTLSQCE